MFVGFKDFGNRSGTSIISGFTIPIKTSSSPILFNKLSACVKYTLSFPKIGSAKVSFDSGKISFEDKASELLEKELFKSKFSISVSNNLELNVSFEDKSSQLFEKELFKSKFLKSESISSELKESKELSTYIHLESSVKD